MLIVNFLAKITMLIVNVLAKITMLILVILYVAVHMMYSTHTFSITDYKFLGKNNYADCKCLGKNNYAHLSTVLKLLIMFVSCQNQKTYIRFQL